MINFLNELCKCTGGSHGNEGNVASAITAKIENFADEVECDVLGNVIAHKKGCGKKIMITANMDSLGAMVTHVSDSGQIRITGKIKPKDWVFRHICFENGTKGIVCCDGDAAKIDEIKLADLYIDIGASNKEEAEKHVKIGDFVVLNNGVEQMGTRIFGRNLTSKIACAVAVEALKQIKNSKNDLYFVFTAQREIGSKGAKVAANSIKPDVVIILDYTNVQKSGDAAKIELGRGACVKIKDGAFIANLEVRGKIECAFKNKQLVPQYVIDAATSDGGALQRAGAGAKVGGISIPLANAYTACEIVDVRDIEAAYHVLQDTINNFDELEQ